LHPGTPVCFMSLLITYFIYIGAGITSI
jgi:hypothetical protein